VIGLIETRTRTARRRMRGGQRLLGTALFHVFAASLAAGQTSWQMPGCELGSTMAGTQRSVATGNSDSLLEGILLYLTQRAATADLAEDMTWNLA
jgi:hypothetical protein